MTESPAWFRAAVALPFTEHEVDSDGCQVRYVRWGETERPSVALVHGGGAHALWWGFIAPLLADTYDVVAVDLSGHGDSGHRERYPREVWAGDVRRVIEHAGLVRPFLVGHSMGGFVSVVSAALFGEALAGAIVVDSPITPPVDDEPPRERRSGWNFRRMTPYADFETAVSRFRLLPPQPAPYPYLLDYVARRSLRATDAGFAWKFDPGVFHHVSRSSLPGYLAAARCRLALVRGEQSVVLSPETAAYMVGVTGGAMPLVEIPEGHHHLMFDQPLPLLASMRALLDAWEKA